MAGFGTEPRNRDHITTGDAMDKRPDIGGGKLGEVLVTEGMVTLEQLEEALALRRGDAGKRLGHVLVSLGHLTETDLGEALAKQHRLAFSPELTERDVEPRAASLVDRRVLRKHGVVPLRIEEGRLVVATSDPANF